MILNDGNLLNTFTSGQNWECLCQNNRIARGFAQEFLWSSQRYRPGHRLKRRDKSFSLQIFFLGGCGFFMSDVLSGGLLGHLGLLYLALGANR